MAKLNQIIAIEKGTKSRTLAELTQAHHALQKPALLAGIARTYTPKDDAGEQLPAESTKVQARAEEMVSDSAEILSKLFDVTATKDWANCTAKADVVVDGKTILKDVPVSYLLFMEKQLVDFHTFVKKLPTLDPSEDWRFDNAQNCYATAPVGTVKTKKVPRNHEKSPATDKHPAQVEVYHEDVLVGTWKTIKYSGAMPSTRVNDILERVEKLQEAVKFAREDANSGPAPEIKTGEKVFKYLLGSTSNGHTA